MGRDKILVRGGFVKILAGGGIPPPPPPPPTRGNPDVWEKWSFSTVLISKIANLISILYKESKKLVKNYRPVLLLPICGKIFERLIYNEMHSYLIDNDLVSLNQSSCKQG